MELRMSASIIKMPLFIAVLAAFYTSVILPSDFKALRASLIECFDSIQKTPPNMYHSTCLKGWHEQIRALPEGCLSWEEAMFKKIIFGQIFLKQRIGKLIPNDQNKQEINVILSLHKQPYYLNFTYTLNRNNKDVGEVVAYIRQNRNDNEIALLMVEEKNSGLGRYLLYKACSLFFSLNLLKINLCAFPLRDCPLNLYNLVKFYRSSGFTPIQVNVSESEALSVDMLLTAQKNNDGTISIIAGDQSLSSGLLASAKNHQFTDVTIRQE